MDLDYKTIYDDMTYKHSSFSILIDYFCYKAWPHPTPDLECFSGKDKVAIIKSFTKKSFLSPQWDIYVAKMEGGKVGDFQGIIKNVDLVSTKSKAEMDVDE